MDRRPIRIVFYSLDVANTFNELLLQGVSDGCKEQGVHLLALGGGQLESTHLFEACRNFLYRLPSPELYDGLLLPDIFSFIPPERQDLTWKAPPGKPVLLVNQRSSLHPHVVVDNRVGFRALVKALLDDGARRLAVVTGPATNHDSRERMETLRSVLDAAGLALPPSHVVQKSFAYTDGLEAVRELLDVRKVQFDALVCFNDNMALSAIAELSRRGIRVPEEVMVTGFDNTEESRHTTPPLTTVKFPMYELGKTGVKLLVDWIRGKPPPTTTTISSSFVPRLSTRGDRAASRDRAAAAKLPSARELETLLIHWYTEQARGVLDDRHGAGAAELMHQLAEHVCTGDSLPARQFEASLEQFSHRGGDLIPWPRLIARLADLVRASEGTDSPVAESLDALSARARALRTLYHINGNIYERQRTHRVLELGESLLTDLDLRRDSYLLANELGELGFTYFAVVRFLPGDTRRATLEFEFSAETGPSTPDVPRPFSTGLLLPRPLESCPPELMVDALHIRDLAIGYLVYNLSTHSGLLYKSLRHQFSTALKTAGLLSEIRGLNHDLEVRIEERTREWKAELEQRSRIEQELLKQRNLDSLGLLAAGLAHDFNNILTGIMGNVSLLESEQNPESETGVMLADILRATERARQVTQQLVTFSRGGSPLLQPTSLPSLIRETADFITRGSAVHVEYRFQGPLGEVAVDSIQMSQVIGNLVLNAMQALTQKAPAGRHGKPPVMKIVLTLEHRLHEGQSQALITVSDNGPGMSPRQLEHLFTPWYTTKESGTGLGLATCRSILERHGGGIEAQSAEGVGTTFRLWIPLQAESSTAVPATEPERRDPGPLKILLLDDDPTVLQVLSRMLLKLGHQTTGVTRGEAALEVFHQAATAGEPYQVLILDLLIPQGMGGREALERLRRDYVGLKALVSSGYAPGDELSRYKELGFQGLLLKPYTIAGLRKAIAELFV